MTTLNNTEPYVFCVFRISRCTDWITCQQIELECTRAYTGVCCKKTIQSSNFLLTSSLYYNYHLTRCIHMCTHTRTHTHPSKASSADLSRTWHICLRSSMGYAARWPHEPILVSVAHRLARLASVPHTFVQH